MTEPSIELTERAAQEFKKFCDQEILPYSLRLIVRGGGCEGFKWELAQENRYRDSFLFSLKSETARIKADGLLNNNRLPTRQHGVELYIDQKVLELMAGAKIDYAYSPLPVAGQGTFGYKLITLSGKSCGCGQSFGVK